MNNHLAVAHRVLVKLKRGATTAEISSLKSTTGSKDLIRIGNQGWYKLDATSLGTATLLDEVAVSPSVAKTEPDWIGYVPSAGNALHRYRRPFFTDPNDPDFSEQWALKNTGQCVNGTCGIAGADVDAEGAWDLGVTGSRAIVIADFDSGIDFNHEDLAANMWSAPSAYTITEGGNVYNCPQGSHGFNALDNFAGCSGQESDDYGHGTPTAGIMGEVGGNGTEGTGENQTASLLSLVVVGSTGHWVESDVVTAIDAAEQIRSAFYPLDIAVGNMSLGGGEGGSALEDEMDSSGILFAAATGNECQSNADYPAAYYLPNEIAVAASDQDDNPAVWSATECTNGGGNIAAPGKNDLSTANGGGTLLFDGTSDATPHVAGAAALVLSVCPLPNSAVVQTLEGTADAIPQLDGKVAGGLRLNIGAAVASCFTGTSATDSASVSGGGGGRRHPDDYGYISITVDGQVACGTSYDTDQDTAATIAENLAGDCLSSKYITATYEGGSNVTFTTRAKGPYTNYPASGQVVDQCNTDCGEPPSISIGSQFTGGGDE